MERNEQMNQDIIHRLNAIIETAIDGIITIDVNGIIESANRAALDLFGYEERELLGQNIKMLMPTPHRENHHKYIHHYIKTREAKIVGIGREVEGVKKDGSRFPFRLAVSEVRFGNQVIFTGIIHDLSDLKEAQSKLINLNTKLENKVESRTVELENVVNQLLKTNTQLTDEVNEREKAERELMIREIELREALSKERELSDLKSRFVSLASHEFRTPLSTILSSASLISRYTETGQQDQRTRHVNKIKSAVSNLNGILNDFLSLSRLEEGKFVVKSENLDLVALSHAVIDELKGIMKAGQIIQYDPVGEKMEVNTDRRIIKNVLINLLSNAIKYSSENKIIELKTSLEKDAIKVVVKDNGIGIPKQEQKHLFDRFFRATNAFNIEGTGLGLNIVRRYVNVLEGSINFTSELNKGSTFTVHLPRKSTQ